MWLHGPRIAFGPWSARTRGTPCSGSRPWPAITSVRPRSRRTRSTRTRAASTRPPSGVRASAGPTARSRRSATPLLPPSLAVHRRDGRQRVQRDHVRRVVEEVDPAPGAAAVVHVVGVATIRRVDRDDRLQRRRPERGHLRLLNPEYEVPYIPTFPLDHSWAASHDRRDVVAELSIRVLVLGHPFGRPEPADVGAADGEVPFVAEPPVDRGGVGEVVLAVRTGLEDDGPRRRRVREVQVDGDPHAVVHLEEPSLVGHRAERYPDHGWPP